MKTNTKSALYAFIASCALNSPSLAQCTSPGVIDPIFQPTTLPAVPIGSTLTLRTKALENVLTDNGNRVVASFHNVTGGTVTNGFFLRRFSSSPTGNDYEDAADIAFRTNVMIGTSAQNIDYTVSGERDVLDIANGSGGDLFIAGNQIYNLLPLINPSSTDCSNSTGYNGAFNFDQTRAYKHGGVSKFDENGILITQFQVDWDSPNVQWHGFEVGDCVHSGTSTFPRVMGMAYDATLDELYIFAVSTSANHRHPRVLRVNGTTGEVISSFNVMIDGNATINDRVTLEFDNPTNPQRLFVVHKNLIYNSSQASAESGLKSDLLILDISQPAMLERNSNWTRAGYGMLSTTFANLGQLNDILVDPSLSGTTFIGFGSNNGGNPPAIKLNGVIHNLSQVASLNITYGATFDSLSVNSGFVTPNISGPCQDLAMDLCGNIIVASSPNGNTNSLRRLYTNGSIDAEFICPLEAVTIDLLVSPLNQIWVGSTRVFAVGGTFTPQSALTVVCNSAGYQGFDYCKNYSGPHFNLTLPVPSANNAQVSWAISAINSEGNSVTFSSIPPSSDLDFQNWVNNYNFSISWQVTITKTLDNCGSICSHLEQWNPIVACAPGTVDFDSPQLRSGTINNPINLNSRPSFTTINVYPNPSSGIFRISGDFDVKVPVEIRAFDLKGIEVKNKVIPTFSLHGEDVDLSGLPSGTYFLKITQNHTTIDSKIVVD